MLKQEILRWKSCSTLVKGRGWTYEDILDELLKESGRDSRKRPLIRSAITTCRSGRIFPEQEDVEEHVNDTDTNLEHRDKFARAAELQNKALQNIERDRRSAAEAKAEAEAAKAAAKAEAESAEQVKTNRERQRQLLSDAEKTAQAYKAKKMAEIARIDAEIAALNTTVSGTQLGATASEIKAAKKKIADLKQSKSKLLR